MMKSENLDAHIRKHTLLSRIFTTAEGTIVIGQYPNWELFAYVVLKIVSLIVPGPYNRYAADAAAVAIIAWSVLEIYSGVNPFRRLLGAAVLISLGLSWLSSAKL